MQNIFSALKISALCLILFSVIYPFSIWAIAQVAPNKGLGETIQSHGRTVGFEKIGQSFTVDKYFNARPSAVAYNAASSGGSNKATTNVDYLKDVQTRIDTFLLHNPDIKKTEIPSELVTSSASGLDPDLSLQGALVQIPRISKTRNISEKILTDLVNNKIKNRLIGTSTINILELNIALDNLSDH